MRIYSTSGTTGTPSYIPLTAGDLENWIDGVRAQLRGLRSRRGPARGQHVQRGSVRRPARRSAPWSGSACRHIPVGTGNSERVLRAIELLRPQVAVLTPSYAAYLLEAGADLRGSSVERVLVAGEPGGGEPAFRARLEEGWGARVTEAMGIGDIGVSLWGECEHQDGMHLGARGFVHAELIDPDTGAAIELGRRRPRRAGADPPAATARRRCCASARATTSRCGRSPCPCGRTGPRIRCVGRTDDMLIVRGVNVFPSAVRDVVGGFAPRVSGHILVRPQAPGVKQEPPLPVSVELAPGADPDASLAEAIRERLREVLVVQARVELVPPGSLARSEYKSRLVEVR